MSANILVTGAAGYIGGSIIARFLGNEGSLFGKHNIWAAVRSQEQFDAVSKTGINVVRVDLNEGSGLEDLIMKNNISIVIHTASAIDARPALRLISALGKLREASGDDVYFIHTSGLSAFYESSGWTHGPITDTDALYELEEPLADSFPVRKTDIAVIEHAKELGVVSFLVVPPVVYGKGSGEWNSISTQFPACIRASIANRATHKFVPNTSTLAVHISDLSAYYESMVTCILKKRHIPSGEKGYYFPIGHDFEWWETLDLLAVALHARGLVEEPRAEVWPTDEFAAKALNFNVAYVRILWNSGTKVTAENNSKLGWEPKWDRDGLNRSLDDEIRDTLEVAGPKSSLFDAINEFVEKNVEV